MPVLLEYDNRKYWTPWFAKYKQEIKRYMWWKLKIIKMLVDTIFSWGSQNKKKINKYLYNDDDECCWYSTFKHVFVWKKENEKIRKEKKRNISFGTSLVHWKFEFI